MENDDDMIATISFKEYLALKGALQLFVKQWNACGPNSDFGRYFQNVKDAADKVLGSTSAA